MTSVSRRRPGSRTSGPGGRTAALLLALSLALYLSTMPTSFVPGDSAYYLNLANTGDLYDRGNGLPLYITVLNAVVHLPLPFPVSDGERCGWLSSAGFGHTIGASIGMAVHLHHFRGGIVRGAHCHVRQGERW